MARNGSGTYTLPAGNPVVSGTTISSTVQNNTLSDIATALTNSIAKDGQTTPTANLPMGSFKHTGVAVGSALTDYARLDQTQNATPQWLTTVAGVDTITATASPVPSAYSAGQTFRFVSTGANTGAATLNISSLGAKAITKNGTTALGAGDITNGAVVNVVYDGTQFQLVSVAGASLGSNTFTGLQVFKTGANIASAATINLSTATGNTVHITGTTTITAVTMSSGQWMKCIFDGACPLTYHATNQKLNTGAANYTTAAGDCVFYFYDGTTVYGFISKADGTPVFTNSKIQSITASVGSNALTITLNPTTLDFRSATLGSGTVNTRTVSVALSVVVSSGSTLGTVNSVQSRLAVIAIDNAGTVELAVVNEAGGNNLDETTMVSTTAEGGAGAADSANVIYSTTARTSVPFRVVGYIESTQATAGTWATAPSTIQGMGGQAMTAWSSLGYGMTWQSVGGSRAAATTYYNTTGRPMMISILVTISVAGSVFITTDGINIFGGNNGGAIGKAYVCAIIPPGKSYLMNSDAGTPTIVTWDELR